MNRTKRIDARLVWIAAMLALIPGCLFSPDKTKPKTGGDEIYQLRTTIDGVDRGKYDTEETQLVGLTGGIDLLHPLSSRVQLAINARYTFNERHLTLQYLGIGPHVVRAGAGVRIRLN